jgi:dipeptidyl aminopeptidase/acylaminoacyl peptidase
MDVEYMVFEDEGHGFTKYSNLVKAQKICRILGREV